MKFKKLFFIGLSIFMSTSSLFADDFDWMVNLNVRSHSDPYGYRYDLADRFRLREPDIMVIVTSVYDPADAYMIFRLAELSGRSPEYILRLYREKRHHNWREFAHSLGIRIDSRDFVGLRESHDLPKRFKHKERYEERSYAPRQKVYNEPQQRRDHNPHNRDRNDDGREDRRERH